MEYKSPDWRYKECLECMEAGGRFRGDRVSRVLYRYLVEKRKLPRITKSKINERYKWVSKAYQIWSDVLPTSDRWLIEAYALTDMGDKAIAEELLIEEKLITTYLDCFFDVRDDLSKRKYVKTLSNYFCAYEHALFNHIGYKYIITTEGVDAFRRMSTRRLDMTARDSDFLRVESKKTRQIKVWSKSWESVNTSAIFDKEEISLLDSFVGSDMQDEKTEIKVKESSSGPGEDDSLKAVFQHVHIQMLNTIDKNLSPVEERLIKVN
jgi:hypothetical protein